MTPQNATSFMRPTSIATGPSTKSRPAPPPAYEPPARQLLAARVGIGIGIGIGIESSQGKPRFNPNTPRQPRALQSRGPRPGGPTDDSPARERWVPSPHEHPTPAGRQIPFPHTNTSIRSRLQSSTTPRNTKRISREEECSPDVFACPPPARNSFSRRDAEPAEVGIPLHHRFPRCARSRCSNTRPRLRSRETSWRASIGCSQQWSGCQTNFSRPFEMELFFKCEGWLLWLLYGFLWQPTSDPARTPLAQPKLSPSASNHRQIKDRIRIEHIQTNLQAFSTAWDFNPIFFINR
jgi:hypothetical protein